MGIIRNVLEFWKDRLDALLTAGASTFFLSTIYLWMMFQEWFKRNFVFYTIIYVIFTIGIFVIVYVKTYNINVLDNATKY